VCLGFDSVWNLYYVYLDDEYKDFRRNITMTWNPRYKRKVTLNTSVVHVPFDIYCKGKFVIGIISEVLSFFTIINLTAVFQKQI